METHARSRVGITLFLALVLLVGFFAIVPPRASAGAAIIFSEDFEGSATGPKWTANDSNPASGLDYWGVSTFRAHGGAHSLWCAQVGNQSSGPFVGLNNSAPGVQQYDDNMQADLVVPLRVNGFSSLTLSFYYFIKTENGGGDWIQAWYEAGGNQTIIFNPRGSSADKWVNQSVAVPVNVERLIIRFHTDTTNHGFEGAYVDDIVLVGFEDVPPSSNVSSLPSHTSDNPLAIPYVAQDNANGSGVDYVELWYRHGTSGTFTLYTTLANPLGRWVSPTIPFDVSLAAGDGYYEFYTIAVDRAGNREAAPATPDASTTIDTAPFPWLLLVIIVAAVIAGLLLFVWWKRRKDREDEEKEIAVPLAVTQAEKGAGRKGAEKSPAGAEPEADLDDSGGELPSDAPVVVSPRSQWLKAKLRRR